MPRIKASGGELSGWHLVLDDGKGWVLADRLTRQARDLAVNQRRAAMYMAHFVDANTIDGRIETGDWEGEEAANELLVELKNLKQPPPK